MFIPFILFFLFYFLVDNKSQKKSNHVVIIFCFIVLLFVKNPKKRMSRFKPLSSSKKTQFHCPNPKKQPGTRSSFSIQLTHLCNNSIQVHSHGSRPHQSSNAIAFPSPQAASFMPFSTNPEASPDTINTCTHTQKAGGRISSQREGERTPAETQETREKREAATHTTRARHHDTQRQQQHSHQQ
jgi:hypothetical protein